jgi:hypothetical protein
MESGIENVKYIFICFVGPEKIPLSEETINFYNKNNNICICKVSEKLEDFEVPTLNFFKPVCNK